MSTCLSGRCDVIPQEFEEQPCFICGGTGHRQYECPNKGGEVFKLPDAIQSKVNEQYERDVQRLHGGELKNTEKEYGDFLQSLGGGPPGGGGGGGRGDGPGGMGGGMGGRGGGPSHEGLGESS